jgi:hypothetical protein
MSTPKLPACCCCSLKVGLLIWILFNIIIGVVSNTFGPLNRNGALGTIGWITSGFGLAISLFGFLSVYVEKRKPVKVYLLLSLVMLLVGTAVSIVMIYSGRETAQKIYGYLIRTVGRIPMDFENFYRATIMTAWIGTAVVFSLHAIMIGFIAKYYQYLRSVEDFEQSRSYGKEKA